jgi:hypothetical protein
MAKSGIIYKLVSNDIEITECYVGSTCDFVKRKCCHKSNCNNEKSKAYNHNVYQFIREHGGWDNWVMVQIEIHKFDIRRELGARERHWVETLQATLNKYVPNREHKQYYQDNVDVKKRYQNQYYRDNVEAIHQHKNQKHDCPCGGKFTTTGLSKHAKTTKHMVYEALHKDDVEDIDEE